ncbi:MAG: AAA family ATPase [Deltaproteobacteria bacterium]|nr:AAA family ATPase [Deltaproteobacteria bacterium]
MAEFRPRFLKLLIFVDLADKMVFIGGPRQVGKTTFLQYIREEGRRYATLDDPSLRALATEDPALCLQRFEPPVLIDEVQYSRKS